MIEGMTITEIVNNLSVFLIMVVIIYIGYKRYGKVEEERDSERQKNVELLKEDRDLHRDEYKQSIQQLITSFKDIADGIKR